ncbi:MAG: hypothetical protein QN135_02655 [Armatimonadota bacterium]|nr:hypothetical protein [Armatimonadota bacterium]
MPTTPPSGSTSRLVAFWLPLALSWLMMSLAQPIVAAGIGRLANPEVHLAAYGVTLDLAVLIESPIIMLFSASVALTKDEATYRLLRRFMLIFAVGLTALFAVVAFTPLADAVLSGLIGVPPAVAAEARTALRWLLPWVPAIAWRRFYQGPLLRADMPRWIGYGTAFRLAALAGAVVAGTAAGLPGATMGAIALSASVVVEALVVTVWALPVVRALPAGARETLTMGDVARFYVPLATTDVMRVVSRPIVTAGVARAALPDISLAAWPVTSGFVHLLTAAVMAFQEMVVAVRDTAGYRAVARFVTRTGVIFSAVLALVAFTPLADVYVVRILQLSAPLRDAVVTALRTLVALPALLALRNLFRGALIAGRRTARVQQAMAGNLVTLAVVLIVGAAAAVPGIVLAAWATLIAQAAEVALLVAFLRMDPSPGVSLPEAAGR